MAKEKKEVKVELDLGLGGLFKGIGSLMDTIAKMNEEGKNEYARTGEITGLGDKVKGVYGFSIRMGVGGQPAVEHFGNIRKTEKGSVEVAEAREPLVDVFDERDYLMVIAELPGVEEKDIHLEIKGDILEVKAEGKDRKYNKEVLLPSEVEADSLKTGYKNGVLEIKLTKKQSQSGGGK